MIQIATISQRNRMSKRARDSSVAFSSGQPAFAGTVTTSAPVWNQQRNGYIASKGSISFKPGGAHIIAVVQVCTCAG